MRKQHHLSTSTDRDSAAVVALIVLALILCSVLAAGGELGFGSVSGRVLVAGAGPDHPLVGVALRLSDPSGGGTSLVAHTGALAVWEHGPGTLTARLTACFDLQDRSIPVIDQPSRMPWGECETVCPTRAIRYGDPDA